MLTVLYPLGEGSGDGTLWVCECDCGNLVAIRVMDLKDGRYPNCGCAPRVNFIDRRGLRYGMLTVSSFVGRGKWGDLLWLCFCDCGQSRVVISNRLVQGQVTHCGCRHEENVREAGIRRRTHGMSRTKLYRAWHSMVSRCENPNNASWYCHGAMGVKVCPEWRDDSESFLKWSLDNGHREGLSLDRYPDPNGNYEPSNCRWATPRQQQRNRRDNFLIEWKSKRRTAAEWSDITGLNQDTIISRLERGWSAKEALTMPVRTVLMRRKRCRP